MTKNQNNRPILTLRKPIGSVDATKSDVKYVQLRPKPLHDWWPNKGTPPPNWVIKHPLTDGFEFCAFPDMKGPGLFLEAGPAFLLFGEHWGRNNGYGYTHILKGHWRELGYKKEPALGPASLKVVTNFLAKVLISRTKILCEFAQLKGSHRPLVVRSGQGTVVLELRFQNTSGSGEPYYSVITGIPGKQSKGAEIGKVV